MTDQSAGWEWMQAEVELREVIEEALNAALSGSATEEQVRLLAWQAGLTNWKPNHRSK